MTIAAYNELLERMLAAGVPLRMAEPRARQEYPDAVPALEAAVARNARILEDKEQSAITKLCRACGCTVRSTSQKRAAKVSPDFPDLWISHGARQFAGWWESKRQVGGARTSGQEEFGFECLAGGVTYGFGDRYDCAAWLRSHGFTTPTDAELERLE